MTLRTILVHLDRTEASAARLDAAVALAIAHDAHLTGLHVDDFIDTTPLHAMPGFPVEYLEQLDVRAKKEAAESEKRFRDRLSRETLAWEWHADAGDTGSTIGLHARYADIAVIGQAQPGASYAGREVPARVALETGRPVLVVPYIGARKTPGDNVLVAWDARREATRAVTDALPVLQRAKKVTVLAFNPEGGRAGHGDIPSADIGRWLAHHDVRVEAAQGYARDVDVGNALLSRVADLGADLLVMGAYGHSRLRELVMGGVTRRVLEEMTVPVLMSH
jgi:nucleotide-binding universal stress UspA family protein